MTGVCPGSGIEPIRTSRIIAGPLNESLQAGYCPFCGELVVARDGELVAHRMRLETDSRELAAQAALRARLRKRR